MAGEKATGRGIMEPSDRLRSLIGPQLLP